MEKTRYFTVEDANRTLPLVKHIVGDILEVGRRLRALAKTQQRPPAEMPQAKEDLKRLNELFSELNTLGCSYRDWNFAMGLVDFPAIIEGKEVLLCWKSDEDQVRYFHLPGTGYEGREPVPEKYL